MLIVDFVGLVRGFRGLILLIWFWRNDFGKTNPESALFMFTIPHSFPFFCGRAFSETCKLESNDTRNLFCSKNKQRCLLLIY